MAKVRRIPPVPAEPTYVAELSCEEATTIRLALGAFKYSHDGMKVKPRLEFDRIEKLEMQFH